MPKMSIPRVPDTLGIRRSLAYSPRDAADPRHRYRRGRSGLCDGTGGRRAQRHRRCSSRWTRVPDEETTSSRCGGRSASGSSANPATGSSNCADPPRARAAPDSPAYRQAVADWHAAPGRRVGRRASNPNWNPAVSARSWRGAIRRSTTARCGSSDIVAARVDIDYDVIPGITAIQALTARHRIPLNDVGEPVLITTGRQLARRRAIGQRGRDARRGLLISELSAGNADLVGRLPRHAGRDAGGRHRRGGRRRESPNVRADARARHGWIMDTYLLRPAD